MSNDYKQTEKLEGDGDSILDRVLSSQTAEEIANFEPHSILNLLFAELSDREKDVIVHRYGLNKEEAKTLEEIGGLFNVTRERIRQIENSSIKKIKKHPELHQHLKPIDNLLMDILEKSGGIMREETLFNRLLEYTSADKVNRAAINFIVSQLLSNRLESSNRNPKMHPSWKLPAADTQVIDDLINELVEILEEKKEPVERGLLVDAVKRRDKVLKYDGRLDDDIINNALDITTKIDTNPFDEWGLIDWRSITPKRMNDKIYLVMKKQGKPLHFTEIAEKINEAKFDDKKAYPATIHNELILDDKYVLVGRGIYALREWGYEPGVVADVIEDIMKSTEGPLTKDEIIKKVLERRMVKKSTIQLALMNKDRFVRVARNKYSLKTATQ
ncbi:MAG: HTH domain-containing protein [Candidatus Komeilibacteria bacterium]|nr:HTH domain-containing protein [Candidatus Komeilibacteria bacterium]